MRHPDFRLPAALLLLALTGGRAEAAADIPFRTAVLQGLDKVTARVTVLKAPVGQEIAFGTLRITARACYQTPPTEPPESAAFLEIRALDGDRLDLAFSGWMFASSPAISALEHPVYDVWVIDCEDPVSPPEPLPLPPPAAGATSAPQNN
jgi:hypothetical protein